jgi:hypothetical protein
MDTQRQIILDLLKTKAESGESQYADLKMKDLRAMKVKQVKDDKPESRSGSSGSEYGSSYESETDSDEEKKKEEKDPTATMPDSHWIVDKEKDEDEEDEEEAAKHGTYIH